MKVIQRSIKLFFGFLALLLIALLAFVLTFDVNNYKPQIIEQVELATGRDFVIDGDINLSIFPWVGLKVENVSLGNDKKFKGKRFAAIKQLDVKVNVLPLLKKQVEINTIRLHGLEVSLEVAENKSNNWSSLSQAASNDDAAVKKSAIKKPPVSPVNAKKAPVQEAGLPFSSLKIEGFEFVDAIIRYQDRSSNTQATISALNLTTNEIQFDQAISLNFSARVVNAEPAIDTQIKLSTLLTIKKSLDEIDLQNFILTILTDANEFIPQKEEIELAANIEVLLDEQRLSLKQVKLSALGVTTLMTLRVNQFLQTPVVQGSIEVQPFNARELARRAAIELPAMAKKTALTRLALKTNIELQGEKFQANNFEFQLDDSTLSGWLHVLNISKQQLRYDLAFDQLNINDYMPPVPAASGQLNKKKAPAKTPSVKNKPVESAKGNEKIELPLEMMRQLDLQGDFRIARLTALDYDIKQLLLTTKAKKGVINIKPLSMQLLQGQVQTSVRIDARKAVPNYVIALNVNKVQIASLVNPALDGIMGEKPLSVEGRVNLKLNIKTTGETVNQFKKSSKGKIVLDMKQTAIKGFDPEFYMRSSVADYVSSKGMDFTDTIMKDYTPRQVTVFDKIYSSINIANGKARTNDFIMSSKRVEVGAKGVVDIVANKLDMNTSVKLPRGKTVVEKILDDPIFVRVFGPFDALEYKLDTSRLKKSTTDVLRKEVKARLDVEKKKLRAKAEAEKQRLIQRARAEEKRLKEKVDAERKRVEEKAKKQMKKQTDSYKEKLKNKLKGLF